MTGAAEGLLDFPFLRREAHLGVAGADVVSKGSRNRRNMSDQLHITTYVCDLTDGCDRWVRQTGATDGRRQHGGRQAGVTYAATDGRRQDGCDRREATRRGATGWSDVRCEGPLRHIRFLVFFGLPAFKRFVERGALALLDLVLLPAPPH